MTGTGFDGESGKFFAVNAEGFPLDSTSSLILGGRFLSGILRRSVRNWYLCSGACRERLANYAGFPKTRPWLDLGVPEDPVSLARARMPVRPDVLGVREPGC